MNCDVIESREVFRGYFRIDEIHVRHETFGGGWTGVFTREIFDRGQAAAVLPYDPVRDEVVLIEQFRAGALASGMENPWLIEVVAGIIDEGETPDEVVRRESVEESGCEIGAMIPLHHFLTTPGACSEGIHLFLGQVDASKAGGVHGLAEENEDIRVFTLSADEAITRALKGEYNNATTLIALLRLGIEKQELRKRLAAAT